MKAKLSMLSANSSGGFRNGGVLQWRGVGMEGRPRFLSVRICFFSLSFLTVNEVFWGFGQKKKLKTSLWALGNWNFRGVQSGCRVIAFHLKCTHNTQTDNRTGVHVPQHQKYPPARKDVNALMLMHRASTKKLQPSSSWSKKILKKLTAN